MWKSNGRVTETKTGVLVSSVKIFGGMSRYQGIPTDCIARRIRYHMEEKGTSQGAAAAFCGCSRDVIFSYMNEKCREENMDIGVLKRLAEYFEKTEYYFCNDYLKFLDKENVSELLKQIRKGKSMTQKQFAELYEIPLVKYKMYESGKVRLQFEYWKKIFPSE